MNQLFQAILNNQRKKIFEEPKHRLGDAVGPRESGVYVLWYLNQLVYVGKAASLYQRLREHARTILEADLITLAEIEVQFLPEHKHFAVAIESFLIDEHRPPWNAKGFGNHAGNAGAMRPAGWNAAWGRVAA